MCSKDKYIQGVDPATGGGSSMGVNIFEFPHATLGEVEYLSAEEVVERYGYCLSESQKKSLKNRKPNIK